MNNKSLILTAIFILFATAASADTSIKAGVDNKSITTDDSIAYKLTISSLEKEIPSPQLPGFDGFYVISQTQSSSISFAKGGTMTELVYIYLLVPKEIGKFKIEASKIKIKNKDYSSEVFEIEVTQGKSRPGVPPEEKPYLPQDLSDSKESQITL